MKASTIPDESFDRALLEAENESLRKQLAAVEAMTKFLETDSARNIQKLIDENRTLREENTRLRSRLMDRQTAENIS